MSTPTFEPRYKLIFTVPHSSLEACKSAIFAKGEYPAHHHSRGSIKECVSRPFTIPFHVPVVISSTERDPCSRDLGAGSYPGGKYSMVCFEMPGIGQFLPGDGAAPNIGAVGKLERVSETRVEVLCVGKDVMTGAVDSLKR